MSSPYFAFFNRRWRLFGEAALAALAEQEHGEPEGQQHQAPPEIRVDAEALGVEFHIAVGG